MQTADLETQDFEFADLLGTKRLIIEPSNRHNLKTKTTTAITTTTIIIIITISNFTYDNIDFICQVYMLWFNFIFGSNFISFVSNSLSSNYHNQNKGNKI